MPINHQLALIAAAREQDRVRRPTKPRLPQPVPEDHIDHGRRYSLAQRVQCLSLLAFRIDP